jgi:hypothetical protein
MTAAAELFGKFGAIDLGSAAAEADFKSAVALLDHDDRGLRAADGERHVHDVFGIGRQSAGGFKIFLQHGGVDEPAVEFDLGAADGAADEVKPGDGVLLVERFVNVAGLGAGVVVRGGGALGIAAG